MAVSLSQRSSHCCCLAVDEIYVEVELLCVCCCHHQPTDSSLLLSIDCWWTAASKCGPAHVCAGKRT